MEISIAMATYNGAPFLAEQLESIKVQTKKPYELIVCDDRSTDTTQALVESFKKTVDFPVRFLINDEKLGPYDNFLLAADLCAADYVSFCDQDDIWMPDKLERVAAAFADTDVDLVAHHALIFNENSSNLGRLHSGYSGLYKPQDLFPWTFFFGFTSTFRKAILGDLCRHSRPIDPIVPHRLMAHDRWVALMASAGAGAYVIPAPLARYRQHTSNASGWMRSSRTVRQSLEAARKRHGYNLVKYTLIADRFTVILRELDEVKRSPGDRAVPTYSSLWQGLARYYALLAAVIHHDSIRLRLRSLIHAYRSGAFSTTVRRDSWRLAFRDLALALYCAPDQLSNAKRLLPTWCYERYRNDHQLSAHRGPVDHGD